MSSNVGLSTPRGSGTSGYVQRNLSLLKPRDRSYGAPFQPDADADERHTFKQRQPDKQILEHDRRRQIEVKILEERDRLEEENEELEERGRKPTKILEGGGDRLEEREMRELEERGEETRRKVPMVKRVLVNGKKYKLSEGEIEQRLGQLRARLTRELEDELAGRSGSDPRDRDRFRGEKRKQGDSGGDGRGKRQFKTSQVHELAEAKIEESERFRRALGIKADGEDSPRTGGRRRDWDRPGREDGGDGRDGRYREDREERNGRIQRRYDRASQDDMKTDCTFFLRRWWRLDRPYWSGLAGETWGDWNYLTEVTW
ncbi:pre-mRNA-splicing factor CWC21 [Coccidioides immitis RMSCC 3703]|uniref:Pre-mRNA-splicing factor CWC21 n=1 Tax=Coccidioides immitis RMSCC 3703 TaxID=454286 RepID=A0A0J8TT23_COCIT|nr:pre-mRNA-splicing factor CWC21 [Coccidioides immitis RMSCC 3703]